MCFWWAVNCKTLEAAADASEAWAGRPDWPVSACQCLLWDTEHRPHTKTNASWPRRGSPFWRGVFASLYRMIHRTAGSFVRTLCSNCLYLKNKEDREVLTIAYFTLCSALWSLRKQCQTQGMLSLMSYYSFPYFLSYAYGYNVALPRMTLHLKNKCV